MMILFVMVRPVSSVSIMVFVGHEVKIVMVLGNAPVDYVGSFFLGRHLYSCRHLSNSTCITQ